MRYRLTSPTPQDQTVFTIRTNFTSPEGVHQRCGRATICICCYGCNVAIRFGPTPQDQTVFTVRTNFTRPEGVGLPSPNL